ncbi:MAG: 1-acyl-sn-glycerol-3-phosphate acyltransferase [Clostridia bacterium]|nr:1-acyl-sn-glycerol-3-phosphate acyltransferase [Clostridia bacterium]
MPNAQRIVYYDDERTDEFSGISRKTVTVDEKFPYLRRSLLFRFAAFFAYRVIMKPFAFLYCKLRFGLRAKGADALRSFRKKGYYLYANHTLMAGDAFIPNLLDFPQKTYIVVHPDNISLPVAGTFVTMCGAIPTPTTLHAHKPFREALSTRISEGACVVIYPEAHIWPYCTRIREFSDVSFAYPVRDGAPVFSATVTYGKGRIGKMPRVTVYVDGPFYPDTSLPPKQARARLRDEVHAAMSARAAEHSTYERIRYVQREEKTHE